MKTKKTVNGVQVRINELFQLLGEAQSKATHLRDALRGNTDLVLEADRLVLRLRSDYADLVSLDDNWNRS